MKKSDNFFPLPLPNLLKLVLKQADTNEILNIPKKLWFTPDEAHPWRTKRFGQTLDSPLGLAAGPHTQLAQNIVAAWLTGARYVELKTVQTLDELEVSKPCIDMQDEGYNCEWSQELKIKESVDEYLNAWIIIHILKHKFGHNGDLGTIFNMSVGYNLEGILKENVQWFFDKLKNCSAEKALKIKEIQTIYPEIVNINIPDCISDNITLSTMHGCPPEEIEAIGKYLIEKKKLHTTIKLNPTLLGHKKLYYILNEKCGFSTEVPMQAFEHDLKYQDAINLIKSLQKSAEINEVFFGLKLTNTLENNNIKDVFESSNEMMYMSGRALHPISINVAALLQKEFNGKLDISFSGGADAYNVADILSTGIKPITMSTDVLKPGGYGRLAQYFDSMKKVFDSSEAKDINSLIAAKNKSGKVGQDAALENLIAYAESSIENKAYHKTQIAELSIKTNRKLEEFDCIAAPCEATCPAHQNIPGYLNAVANEDFQTAARIIMDTNPLPTITGIVCDHQCTTKCTRINYDNPVQIREVKNFVAKSASLLDVLPTKSESNGKKVAIIGAGPSGLSCAYYLIMNGFEVNVYEEKSFAGGMASGAIPEFRLDNKSIKADVERLQKYGVQIHFNTKVDKELYTELYEKSDYLYLAIGAAASRKLAINGIDTKGVIEPLDFLLKVRKGEKPNIGKKVAVIGGGNTAMDAARTAWRLVGDGGDVTIIYRRTISQMPADFDEIQAVIDEGVTICELTSPVEVVSDNGVVKSLRCEKMQLSEKDSSGRARPVRIENSEFDIEFDTIIPAIGQDVVVDFIDNEAIENNEKIYETKIAKLFVGGDAMRGGATVISAIADGRYVADKMMKAAGIEKKSSVETKRNAITNDVLMVKRAKRQFSTAHHSHISLKRDFKLINSELTKKQAIEEAKRCLFCDEICNICVTVCPNIANYAYEIETGNYPVYQIKARGEEILSQVMGDITFSQKNQVLNIANWCNECGNCNTFCPTADAPYLSKPRLHLTKESFEAVENGYLYDNGIDGKAILCKLDGQRYVLIERNAEYWLVTGNWQIVINKETKKPVSVNFYDQAKVDEANTTIFPKLYHILTAAIKL